MDYQVSSKSSKIRFRLDFQSLFRVKNSKVCRQDPWMTIKLSELHVCLWNRLETSAGPPAPYRRRSTFKSVQTGWTALAGKAMEATFGAPTQWCESCSFYTVRGGKILIPAGPLTAVEESQGLEVKGWSSLLWLACCWKIHLKRSIHHVGDDVAPVLIGGGVMLPTCDHSNGLTHFQKRLKMHVIRFYLHLWYKTTSSAGQTKPERNLRRRL